MDVYTCSDTQVLVYYSFKRATTSFHLRSVEDGIIDRQHGSDCEDFFTTLVTAKTT